MTAISGMDHRYPCCDHCPDEACPRIAGHAAACQAPGCPSNHPTFGDDPIPLEDIEPGVIVDIKEWMGDQRIVQMREDLIDGVTSVMGHEPPGIRFLLRALSHPDMAGIAKDYFELLDVNSRCTTYEPPWSCAKQAEAQYENIKEGWLGGVANIGYDDTWCEPCRRKVMGT